MIMIMKIIIMLTRRAIIANYIDQNNDNDNENNNCDSNDDSC